jgi:uncharacterized protein (UPF0264 family)
MTKLLVSVRSAAEAEVALDGGAALIDVKEPANGALGMAPLAVIGDVIRAVSGRAPVSAALGEARDAWDFVPADIARQLAFVKYGCGGCDGADVAVWRATLARARRRLADVHARCQVVVAAYADWQRARSPSPVQLCHLACEQRAGAFLLDTWGKDGSTLLDWIPPRQIADLCCDCAAAGVPVALAGSLGAPQIRALLPLQPDWIAVRGAACVGVRRENHIDLGKVRGLAAVVRGVTAASPAN